MRYVPADHKHSFTASNVPIEEPLYNPATIYSVGDRVYAIDEINYTQDEWGPTSVYQSIQDDNMGNDPASSLTFWSRVGPTNRWAMRDATSGEMTVHDSDIVVQILTGEAPYQQEVSMIGVGFCVGKSVTVEVLNWEDPNADTSYQYLAALHHFEDTADESSNNNDLTLVGDCNIGTDVSSVWGTNLVVGPDPGYAKMIGNSSLSPSNLDFCIEFFCIFNVSGRDQVLYSQGDSSAGAFLVIRRNADNTLSAYASNTDSVTGVTVVLDSGYTLVQGTEYHIRFSRSGDTWRIFVNGSSQASTTWSGTLDLATDTVWIGSKYVTDFNAGGGSAEAERVKTLDGYVEELRVTIGDSRGTTGTYSVPTEPYNDAPVDLPGSITVDLDNELNAQTEPLWNSIYGGFRKETTDSVFISLGAVVVNPEIKITITKGASYRASCGAVGWGNGSLGDAMTMWGVKIGMIDYSRKEVNDYGVVEFKRRPYAPTLSATLELPREEVDNAVPNMAWMRARPVFWDFNNTDQAGLYSDFKSLKIIGAFKSFDFELVDIEQYKVSIDIEGVI